MELGRRIGKSGLIMGLIALLLGACGDQAFAPDERSGAEDMNQDSDWMNGGAPGNEDDADAVPEAPQEYEFSAPAIIGEKVYVANETLNSVAIIDSRSLHVRSVMTGAQPTEVVGPGVEGPAGPDARVMALNRGNHTVTLIDPEDDSATNMKVLPYANRISAAPGGRHGVVWFDSARATASDQAGDLSAVSVVSAQGSFQIAVGFHVREIRFDEAGELALVVTDDGISLLKLASIEGDGYSPPRNLIPEELSEHRVRDLNLSMTGDGRYVVAYRPGFSFLIVADLVSAQTFSVELPAGPTGVALRESDDGVEALVVLRSAGAVLRADLPDGFLEARAAQEEALEEDEEDELEAPAAEWDEFAGYRFVDLPVEGLGSLGLSADGERAIFFTTVGEETRAVLMELESEENKVLNFEKTIRGVLSDERGETFLVFHDKKEGSLHGLTPLDPEYVARSWGFSILDNLTGTTRLILTEHEPADAALWSPESGEAKAYLSFKLPEYASQVEPGHRDIVQVNLQTFRKDVFRLSSLPDGLGLIPSARRVYINQIHPQGRMTFLDVDSDERETVTGYQLNAGIQ